MCPPNPIPPADAVRTVRRPDGTFTYLTESAITLQSGLLESSVTLLESTVALLESAITLEESAISILEAIESNTDGIEAALVAANASLDAIEADADAIRVAAQSIDTDFDVALSTRASEATLASAAASLSILDDWDESDRAKVNIIVGQAGVQGGSGVVSANTQRTTLATDVALPAGTNRLGSVFLRNPADSANMGSEAEPVFARIATAPTMNRSNVTVGAAAVLVIAANTARQRVDIFNNGNQAIYIGPDNTVATTTGLPVPPAAVFTESDYRGDIYGIATANRDVRILEIVR